MFASRGFEQGPFIQRNVIVDFKVAYEGVADLLRNQPPSGGSAGFDFNSKPDSRYYGIITAGRGIFRMQE